MPMTPAERALLLAALSDIATDKREHGDDDDALLIRCQQRAIEAVEAYGAKPTEAKSCAHCPRTGLEECFTPEDYVCRHHGADQSVKKDDDILRVYEEAKADVCPTCKGRGGEHRAQPDTNVWVVCPDCGGTGKKEKETE